MYRGVVRRSSWVVAAGALAFSAPALVRPGAAQPAVTVPSPTASSSSAPPPAAPQPAATPPPATAPPPAVSAAPADEAAPEAERRRDRRARAGGASTREERGEARVHVAVDRRGGWLEARSWVDDSDWRRVCAIPCGRVLLVDGQQFRVVAPGMAPSNPFRVEPGAGTARIKVSGGSESARRWGTISLAVGIPVSLLGMAGFAYGRVRGRDGVELAGTGVLALGSAAVIVSFPLLNSGSTVVRNSRGRTIGRASAPAPTR